jgi:hypothetical protein
LDIFSRISKDVHALQSPPVPDRKASVCFGALEPLPYFAKNQPHSSRYCEGINIQIFDTFDFPVPVRPKGHAVSHGGSAVGNPHSEGGGTIKDPLRQPEGDLGQLSLRFFPVDCELVRLSIRLEFLDGKADVPEYLGLEGI